MFSMFTLTPYASHVSLAGHDEQVEARGEADAADDAICLHGRAVEITQ